MKGFQVVYALLAFAVPITASPTRWPLQAIEDDKLILRPIVANDNEEAATWRYEAIGDELQAQAEETLRYVTLPTVSRKPRSTRKPKPTTPVSSLDVEEVEGIAFGGVRWRPRVTGAPLPKKHRPLHSDEDDETPHMGGRKHKHRRTPRPGQGEEEDPTTPASLDEEEYEDIVFGGVRWRPRVTGAPLPKKHRPHH